MVFMTFYEIINKVFKLFIFLYLLLSFIIFRKNIYNRAINRSYNNNFFISGFKYTNLFLNFNNINYYFSYRYGMVEVEFNIAFYDINNNLIIPSNLALYNDLHVICHIKKKNKNNIDSLSNIYINKYFNCIEYFQLNEKLKLGIKIIKSQKNIGTFYFFNHIYINYNNLKNLNDDKFDCLKKNIVFKKFINKKKKLNKYFSLINI